MLPYASLASMCHSELPGASRLLPTCRAPLATELLESTSLPHVQHHLTLVSHMPSSSHRFTSQVSLVHAHGFNITADYGDHRAAEGVDRGVALVEVLGGRGLW